jgi:hypothetical protein
LERFEGASSCARQAPASGSYEPACAEDWPGLPSAYNAGSGAVGACSCIPYAETRAYVARILALANGAGVLLSPPLEVRLVS